MCFVSITSILLLFIGNKLECSHVFFLYSIGGSVQWGLWYLVRFMELIDPVDKYFAFYQIIILNPICTDFCVTKLWDYICNCHIVLYWLALLQLSHLRVHPTHSWHHIPTSHTHIPPCMQYQSLYDTTQTHPCNF